MSIWEILGIEQTDDISAIRRAYAKLLKMHHPEDDPAGYQRLREAYDRAMKLAKQRQQEQILHEEDEEELEQNVDSFSFEGPMVGEIPHLSEEKDTPDDTEGEDPLEIIEELDEEPDAGDDFDFDDEDEYPVDEFMTQVQALYSDFAARMNTRRWLELLSSDTLWNIDYHRAVAERMLDYCEQNYFLPREVWAILEEHFHWRERSMDDEDFDEEYHKINTYAIMDLPGLHMDYSAILQAQGMADERREEFLRYREAVAIALMEDDRRTAHVNLIKALDIFQDDKDLLWLQAEFYRRTGNSEQALASCINYIRLAPTDIEALLMRARLLLGMNRFPEALEDVQQVLARMPKHAEALALAGQCQLKLWNMDQAKAYFNQVLAIDGEDIEAVLGLAEVHRYTESSLPYLKGPARKQARREINLELGRLPLLKRLIRAAALLLSRRWHVLTLIIILHVIISQSISDYYIVADDMIRTTVSADMLPPKVIFLTGLLILFYIPFIQEARRQWRYIRYN